MRDRLMTSNAEANALRQEVQNLQLIIDQHRAQNPAENQAIPPVPNPVPNPIPILAELDESNHAHEEAISEAFQRTLRLMRGLKKRKILEAIEFYRNNDTTYRMIRDRFNIPMGTFKICMDQFEATGDVRVNFKLDD